MKIILIYLLSIASLLYSTNTLNFPLSRSRQTCMIISQGSYQIQYVISGHSQRQVRCIIQQNDRIIYQITGQSQFQGQFNVTSEQASICFSSLDNLAKSVSVDFFKTDDPLKGIIQDQKKLKIHEELYKSFQQAEKVYRDQHFFMQRNYIHSILLKQTEVIGIFLLLLKIICAFSCSFFQMYYVKKTIEDSFSPLPTQQRNDLV